MRRFVVLIFTALALATAAEITQEQLDEALENLDRSLANSGRYEMRRLHAIDSLRANAEEDPTGTALGVADIFISFNTDSAIHVLTRGGTSVEGVDRLPFRWRMATLLPLVGFTEDGKREYEQINRADVPQELMADYLEAGRQMYSYVAAFYRSSPELYQGYVDSVRSYQRQLLEVLDSDSDEYRYTQAEYYFLSGRQALAKVLFEDLMQTLPWNSKLKARAAHHLAAIAHSGGDRTAYLYYLALSARSDVEMATREMVSLQELGAQLSDVDVDRAYTYTNHALQAAVDCGATLRAIDTSQALPVIEKAHNDGVARWRRTVYAIMGVMGALLLALICTLLVLRYEIGKMRRLQASLRETNKAKEIYISQFMELCSVYMNKLNQFSKIVVRKLAVGQSDELYRMAKSGKFVDEQSREFYDIFDEAFLHIYPNFVSKVNALLLPDSQIELKDGEKLNTDLRILAFMRLGIDESAKMAEVLNYSINTIYSYRNRLKARAKNRETFEQDIASLE